MIRTSGNGNPSCHQFHRHASEEAKAKADPAKGKVIAETVCVACHGADGNSAASANPHLAGQVEEYIYKQLKNFKAVDGKPAARNNAIMGGMVAPLSDEDMKNVAAWFASQKLKPAVPPRMKPRLRWARNSGVRATSRKAFPPVPAATARRCRLPAQYPRLAGQFPNIPKLS
jgi:cytochrome c553